MAPTTRLSCSSNTVAPPPDQIRFPRRRKLVRPRASPPTLSKRQSTLTQIEYIRTPHSSARNLPTAHISSDDDEDDWVRTRSSKRRKTTSAEKSSKTKKRGSRQSTLTQKWDMNLSPEIKDSDDSDDNDVNDTTTEADEESIGEQHGTRHNLSDEERYTSVEGSTNSSHPREIPESATISESENQSTRPTTANLTDPRTPRRKIIRTCIPSSNTPASIILSMHSVRGKDIDRRSPLKERNVNANASRASPTLSTAKYGLERLQEQSPDPENEPPWDWTATLTVTPKKTAMQQPRTLKRTATVQDSEDEDMEFDDLEELPTKHDAVDTKPRLISPVPGQGATRQDPRTSLQASTTDPGSQERPDSPTWKRTGIVPDSEQSSVGPNVSSPMQDDRDEAHVTDSGSSGGPQQQSLESLPSGLLQTTDNVLNDVEASPKSARSSPEAASVAQEPTPFQQARKSEARHSDSNLASRRMSQQETCPDAEGRAEHEQLPSDPLEAGVIEIHDDADSQHVDDEEDYYTADDEYPEADYELYEQHTYDPVQAALERDAARFGKSDTQLNAEQQPYTQFVPYAQQQQQHHHDDENDDDLVEDYVTNEQEIIAHPHGPEPEFVPSSQPNERNKVRAHTQAQDIDDSGYISHTERVPSSQSPVASHDSNDLPTRPSRSFHRSQLRPSQVSTVVDTQRSSPPRPGSAGAGQEESWPRSSSPFPLPPGFSLKRGRDGGGGGGGGETQMSLTDFSLPPPPPLWTSSEG